MPVTQDLISQIDTLKPHYSTSEIFDAIKANPKYSDVSEQISSFKGQYGDDEILQSLYDSPSLQVEQPSTIPSGGVSGEWEEDKGFGTRLLEGYGERAGKVAKEATMPLEGDIGLSPESLVEPVSDIASRALYAGSQAIGAAFDIPMEAVKSLYRSLPVSAQMSVEEFGSQLSEEAKEYLSTDMGQKAVSVLEKGGKFLAKWAEDNPVDARILKSMPEFLIGGKTTQLAREQVKPFVSKTVKKVEQKIEDISERKISKLPTAKKEQIMGVYDEKLKAVAMNEYSGIAGWSGKTVKQHSDELSDVAIANRTILELKNKFKLESGNVIPESIEDYSESVAKSKIALWKDVIAPKLGMTERAGFKVSLKDSIDDMSNMLKDEVTMDMEPTLRKYLIKRMEVLQKYQSRGGMTVDEAQTWITRTNKSMSSFYNKLSSDFDSKLGIDSVVANRLRSKLDEAVDLATGEGIQPFKNQYKALMSIEKGVNQARNRELKQLLGQNSPSYFDLGTDWGIIGSVLTANPKMLIASIGVKGVKAWQTKQMGSTARVRRMFKVSDKLVKRRSKVEASIPIEPRPVPKQLEYTPRMGMEERSGIIKPLLRE